MTIVLTKQPSGNRKLGFKFFCTYRKVGLPENKGTCPASCPQLKSRGCYALYGHVNMVQSRGEHGKDDLSLIRDWIYSTVPRKGFYIRHFVSGDFGDATGKADVALARGIRDLHKEAQVRGFGYTHFWRELEPSDTNNQHLTFNASCESLEDAYEALAKGWPVVLVVPADAPDELEPITLGEHSYAVKVCKEQTEGKTCSECMICMRSNRKEVVAFRAHSSGAKHVKTA